MLLTMPSARRPCSAIFSRLLVSMPTVSSISARVSSSSPAMPGAAAPFNPPRGAPPVRPGPLETRLAAGVLDAAADFRLELGPGRAVFAAVRHISEILLQRRPLRNEIVRQVEDLLKIHVPRGEPHLVVEHR